MLKRTVSFFRPLSTAFVLACLLLSGNAVAGGTGSAEPWNKRFFVSTGQDLISAAQAVPLPEKDAVVVLLDEGTFSFDAEGRCTARYRLSYRILTAAGVDGLGYPGRGLGSLVKETPDPPGQGGHPAQVGIDRRNLDLHPCPKEAPPVS